MRKLLLALLFILFCTGTVFSASVTLAWDASPTADVAGYALYDRNFQKPYNYSSAIWTGTGLTATVTVPDDRQSAFVARAFTWGPYDLNGNRAQVWSDNSNETTWTPAAVKPEPPRNFLVRILVAIASFFGKLLG